MFGVWLCRCPHLATLVLLDVPVSHRLALAVVHKHNYIKLTGLTAQRFPSDTVIEHCFCQSLVTAVVTKLLLFTLVRYLSDHVSDCLNGVSVCLSVCLTVCLSDCLSVSLSLPLPLSLFSSTLSVCLFVCVSLSLFFCY